MTNSPLLSDPIPFFARRSMSCVSIQDKIYFFGGVGASGTESILDVSSDLWVFDTSALKWKELLPTTAWPSPRRCSGFSSLGEKLYLFGGSGLTLDPLTGNDTYNFLNDEWSFDTSTQEWRQTVQSELHLHTPLDLNRPFPRYFPNFHSSSSGSILFGGYTEDRLGKRKLNDLWLSTPGNYSWDNVHTVGVEGYNESCTWPGVRYGSMSSFVNGKLYLFGGFSDDGDHNDLWCFDTKSLEWTLFSPEETAPHLPLARYCAAFAYYDNSLYLFGGRSRSNPKLNLNDLWRFDLNHKAWILLHPSTSSQSISTELYPPYHAKASFATVGHSWYILGGERLTGHVSDFWRYNFIDQSWVQIQSPRSDDPIFW